MHSVRDRTRQAACSLGVAACLSIVAIVGVAAATARAQHIQRDDVPIIDAPVGQYGGVTRVIVVDGDTAWIGHGTRLALVDFADPTAPRLVDHGAMLDDLVTGVAIDGEALHVTTQSSLHSFALDSALQQPSGTLLLDSAPRKLLAANGYAFVLQQQWGSPPASTNDISATAVSIVDVRDLDAPRLAQENIVPHGLYAIDVLLRGGRLYVSASSDPNATLSEQSHVLLCYDIADPASPRLLVQLEDPAWGVLAAPPDSENQTILGLANGLAAFDLTDIASPIEIARYSLHPTFGYAALLHGYPRMVVDASGRPFIADNGGFGLLRVDGSARPKQMAYVFDGAYHDGISASDAVAAVQQGGASDVVRDSIDLYDITDPTMPVTATRITPSGFRGLRDMPIHSGVLYTAGRSVDRQRDTLEAWDISTPSRPRQIGSRPIDGRLSRFDHHGDTIALARNAPVASNYEEPEDVIIELVDARQTDLMPTLRTIDLDAEPGYHRSFPLISYRGRYAYVVAAVGSDYRSMTHNIHVVDLAPPIEKSVAVIPLDGWPVEVRVADGHAFVNQHCHRESDRCGISVYDVREPAAAQFVARFAHESPGYLNTLAIHDGLVYVAAGARGVEVFRLDLAWEPEPAIPTYTPQPTQPVTPTATADASPSPTPTESILRSVLLPWLGRSS